MKPGSVRKLFEQKLQQKLEAVFNSISLIERITFLQFRDIQTYDKKTKYINLDFGCSPSKKCIIADVQLTLQQVGAMNNGKSMIESTKSGLELAKTATREVLIEFASDRRLRQKSDPELVVEVSSPITPIGDIPAIYILTSVCVLGCIGAAVYFFWSYFKILYESHKIVWKHGTGTLGRIKVMKNCLLLAVGFIAVVAESLCCRDYVLGKRRESARLVSIDKTEKTL